MAEPVLLFPGQGYRDPRMLERILAAWPKGAELVERASDRLHRDLRATIAADPPSGLARDIQIGVFLTNHIFLEALRDRGVDTPHSIGMSLGEYNHIVHVGAIEFLAGLELVDLRGRLCDTAVPGKLMAAMPASPEDVQQLLDTLSGEGVLSITCFNSPTQQVFGGDPDLVDRLAELLEDEIQVMCFPVNDRVAMHTSLLDEISEEFLEALLRAPWLKPHAPYRPGIAPTRSVDEPAALPDLLKRHLVTPVHFQRSLDGLLDGLDDPVLVSCGPGQTLSNLVKRWRREPFLSADDPAGEMAPIATVAREILDATR